MKKLNRTLKQLLLFGVSQAGTFDPEEVLYRIEEQLTGAEYKTAEEFLRWLTEQKLQFGHGNIDSRYAEFRKSKGE